MKFDEIFITEPKPYKGRSSRDKFLSRVFGIFSEEIIRIWCRNERSPFIDLGRPVLHDLDGKRYTLDFLLQDREGRCYVTEMKCEIEYQKYKYLTLIEPEQLKHHGKRAFQLLLEIAKRPSKYTISRESESVVIAGASLIWGATTEAGVSNVRQCFGFAHILSMESIINELIAWQDAEYLSLISHYRNWSGELFDGLADSA
ncbi:MAG: hypothetical protein Q8K12_00450 [Thiobacillus sp.]|nr:hypothetical protein [Thiobacillus sp.]